MYCTYHPSNSARVKCASCSRALCTYCDHRIKGYPYCQDCIVTGIESLSRTGSAHEGSKARAGIAALCALIPGMGAVYNRQNVRAIVHFVVTMGLFRLSSIHEMAGFFALAGFAFYMYTIIDAYRTANMIANGEDPVALDERFRRSLIKRVPLLGILLVIAGLALFVQIVHPFALGISLLKLAPVALIFLGGYLIVSYLKRSNGGSSADYAKPSSVVYFSKSGGERRSSDSGRYVADRSDFMR